MWNHVKNRNGSEWNSSNWFPIYFLNRTVQMVLVHPCDRQSETHVSQIFPVIWPSQDSTSGKWGERVQKPLFPVYTEGRGSLLRKVWSQSEALNASSEPNKSGGNLTGGGECGALVWKRCRCNFPTRFFQDQLFWCQLFKHKKGTGETLTPTTELKVQT